MTAGSVPTQVHWGGVKEDAYWAFKCTWVTAGRQSCSAECAVVGSEVSGSWQRIPNEFGVLGVRVL